MRWAIISLLAGIVVLADIADVFSQLQLGTAKQASGSFRIGGDVGWLFEPQMRRALELSKEQEGRIVDAQIKLAKMAQEAEKQRFTSPTADVDDLFKDYNAAAVKLVKDELTEKQVLRFKQIVYQVSGLDPLFREEVRRELGLSQQQQSEIKKLKDMHTQDKRKGLSKGRDQSLALDRRYLELGVNLLSETQKAAWSKLIGKPVDYK
jgi:polyribonucleotide nucleotidyltransferase